MESLKKMSRKSYKGILPDSIINKPKTGWTAPINLWRTQFNKDCKEINYITNQITNVSLPDDKRWAPIFTFTWKNIFKMNYN